VVTQDTLVLELVVTPVTAGTQVSQVTLVIVDFLATLDTAAREFLVTRGTQVPACPATVVTLGFLDTAAIVA
jgi:hypothetical protein